MAKKHIFDSGVDLKKSELFNSRLQNLFIYPANPAEGQIIYRSDLKVGAFWDGFQWLFFGNPADGSSPYDLQKVTDAGNVTDKVLIHADAVNLNESATLNNVKEITGFRENLTTNDKTNLVQSINEVNAWDMEEW